MKPSKTLNLSVKHFSACQAFLGKMGLLRTFLLENLLTIAVLTFRFVFTVIILNQIELLQ